MQYPEFTSVTVVQAWPEPGSLKSCGGHHLEPQGSRAYSSAVPRVIFSRSLTRSPSRSLSRNCSRNSSRNADALRVLRNSQQHACEPLAQGVAPTVAPDGNP